MLGRFLWDLSFSLLDNKTWGFIWLDAYFLFSVSAVFNHIISRNKSLTSPENVLPRIHGTVKYNQIKIHLTIWEKQHLIFYFLKLRAIVAVHNRLIFESFKICETTEYTCFNLIWSSGGMFHMRPYYTSSECSLTNLASSSIAQNLYSTFS